MPEPLLPPPIPGGILVNAQGRIADPAGIRAGPGGAGCCYRQSRKCSDNLPSGKWLPLPLIPPSRTIIEGGTCYYFTDSDNADACAGTLHTIPVTPISGCGDPACGGGTPGPSCYLCTPGTEPQFVDVVLNLNLCLSACSYEYSGASGVVLNRYQFAACVGLIEQYTNIIIDVNRIRTVDPADSSSWIYGWVVTATFEDGSLLLNETIYNGLNCSTPFTVNKSDGVACGFNVVVTTGGNAVCTPTNL